MVCFTSDRGRMISIVYLCADRLGIERRLDPRIDPGADLTRDDLRCPGDDIDLLDNGLAWPRACSLHISKNISIPSVFMVNPLNVIGG